MTSRPVGQTRDAGWEIGVSRTVPYPVEEVWEFLTSPAGVGVWLGAGVARLDELGMPYTTQDGTVGEVRSFRPRDRVRLTWRPADWHHDSTVQVAVVPAAGHHTSLRFHQERLVDADERERQRTHWRAVLDAVTIALDGGQ